jgi:hypothetical protein
MFHSVHLSHLTGDDRHAAHPIGAEQHLGVQKPIVNNFSLRDGIQAVRLARDWKGRYFARLQASDFVSGRFPPS